MIDTQEKIQLVFDTLSKIVIQKNEQYGDSAITPLGIFCKSANYQQIASRLDDKLLRLKNLDTNSAAFRDTVVDLMGYLCLLIISKGWENDIKKGLDDN